MLDKITPGVSNPNNKSHFYKFSRKPIILRAVIDEGYYASNTDTKLKMRIRFPELGFHKN